jgi:predicted nuclease with TOPRIM domain
MRACYKTRNFAPLLGLIEEAQTLANRMEAHLDQAKEYFELRDKCRELAKELKELKKEKEGLQGQSASD